VRLIDAQQGVGLRFVVQVEPHRGVVGDLDLRDSAATRQFPEAEQPDVVVLAGDSSGAFRSKTV
jgi:hypothetical protein